MIAVKLKGIEEKNTKMLHDEEREKKQWKQGKRS